MTLEQVYYVGQTVAVAAILVSLIYLGAQVRQNGRVARADITWRHQQAMRDLLQMVIADPELAAAWHNVMVAREGRRLDEVTRTRFLSWIESVLMGMEGVYVLRGDGLVEPGIWARWEEVVAWYLQRGLIRRYWEAARFRFSPAFAAYVDALAERAAARGEPAAASQPELDFARAEAE